MRLSGVMAACSKNTATRFSATRPSLPHAAEHMITRPLYVSAISMARSALYILSTAPACIGIDGSHSRTAAWKNESGAIKKICFLPGSYITATPNYTGVATTSPHQKISCSNQQVHLTVTLISSPKELGTGGHPAARIRRQWTCRRIDCPRFRRTCWWGVKNLSQYHVPIRRAHIHSWSRGIFDGKLSPKDPGGALIQRMMRLQEAQRRVAPARQKPGWLDKAPSGVFVDEAQESWLNRPVVGMEQFAGRRLTNL